MRKARQAGGGLSSLTAELEAFACAPALWLQLETAPRQAAEGG